MTPAVAMEVGSRIVTEWVVAQEKSQVLVRESEGSSRVGWQSPDAGWHKLNVDALIHEGDSFFKVGMVLRNNHGVFVAGMQKCIAEKVTVLEAEVVGLQEALNWIHSLTADQVVVESDSLTLVKLCFATRNMCQK